MSILSAGTHDLSIFAAAGANTPRWKRAGPSATRHLFEVETVPFREADFDLGRPEAKVAGKRAEPLGEGTLDKAGTSWDFKFPPISVRHVRIVIHEYRGEAVAINHVEIRDSEKNILHIPTEADLLSLATNDILEIGGGDVITATYIDDLNQTGGSRLLTAQLTATYHNATITPISYDFLKTPTETLPTPQGSPPHRSRRTARHRSHRLRHGHHGRPGQDQGPGGREQRPGDRPGSHGDQRE